MLLGICLKAATWLKLWSSRVLPTACEVGHERQARTVLSASAGVSSSRATGLMRFWFLLSKKQRANLFYLSTEYSLRASWVEGGGGFGRGAARAGTRAANRFTYVFGPILIFVIVLTAWYVASPSSFNTMTEAVSKFIKAWRG